MTTVTGYQVECYQDVEVCWLPELDGGGRSFGQDYLPVVRSAFGRVGRVHEFCSGPGFIGFSLLANGLCDELTVADVNPAAVAALRETVRRNGLADRVRVYESNGLDDIPAEEKWDLVVGNPPHFATPFYGAKRRSLITDDLGWKLHDRFYRAVGAHLSDGGSVLLQENSKGSSTEDFLPMLAAGGLTHLRTLWYSPNGQSCFYYLWAQRAVPGLLVQRAEPPVRDIDLAVPASVAFLDNPLVRVRLHNRLDRIVRPQLVTDGWSDALKPIRPGESLLLPALAFHPGRYVVDERFRPDGPHPLAVFTVLDRP